MASLREDGLHRLTTRLARENAVVVIEDLNVKGMGASGGAHKRGLNRSLADAAFGQFRRMLEYKGLWYGVEIVVADRWFPSSKTCSECRAVKAKLPLSERLFVCNWVPPLTEISMRQLTWLDWAWTEQSGCFVAVEPT